MKDIFSVINLILIFHINTNSKPNLIDEIVNEDLMLEDELVEKMIFFNIDSNDLTVQYKKLDQETKIISFKRGLATCTGSAYLNGELACSADFILMLADEIEKFRVKI